MEREFEAEFGFLPTDAVDGYKCSVVSNGDSLGTWFSFNCPESMFEKLHATGFQIRRLSESSNVSHVWEFDVSGNPNAPKWWPEVSKSSDIYWKEWHSENQMGHFIYFWRDAKSDRIFSKCGDWR